MMARTNDAAPRMGDYDVRDARTEPYLMERMGREIELAAAVATLYPAAPPMIPKLRVEDWPAELAAKPADYPYRIVVEYHEAFIRFVAACEVETQDMSDARQRGAQREALALDQERNALALILHQRGEPIGHSVGGNTDDLSRLQPTNLPRIAPPTP
jgi:hypothetical protein